MSNATEDFRNALRDLVDVFPEWEKDYSRNSYDEMCDYVIEMQRLLFMMECECREE